MRSSLVTLNRRSFCVWRISSVKPWVKYTIPWLPGDTGLPIWGNIAITSYRRVTKSRQAFVTGHNKMITVVVVGSLSNHDDDDGNKNPTNLHIWQWKRVVLHALHALHVHFSSFDILKSFSFFLQREMTCFAVVWTTWAYDDKCSILSSYVPSVGSNLIPG